MCHAGSESASTSRGTGVTHSPMSLADHSLAKKPAWLPPSWGRGSRTRRLWGSRLESNTRGQRSNGHLGNSRVLPFGSCAGLAGSIHTAFDAKVYFLLFCGWGRVFRQPHSLCLSGLNWLGAITPIGGICLIAGWLSCFLPAPKTRA